MVPGILVAILTLAMAASPAMAQGELGDTLVFHLDFEEGEGVPIEKAFGFDVSVGGDDGGTIAYSDDAAVGDYSFDFDGSTYLEVAHSDTLTNQRVTVDFWFKAQELPTGDAETRLVAKVNSSQWWNTNYEVRLNADGDLLVGSKDRNVGTNLPNLIRVDDAVEVGEWYRLVYAVHDDIIGTQVWDADGRLVGTSHLQMEPDLVQADGPLRIGRADDRHGAFNGLIDEVRIYNYERDFAAPFITGVAPAQALYAPQDDSYQIEAQLTSTGDATPTVTLHYDLGAGWQETTMTSEGSGTFTGAIPGPSTDQRIEYYVTAAANDTSGFLIAPASAPGHPYTLNLWGEANQAVSFDFEEGEGVPSDQSAYAGHAHVSVGGDAAYTAVDGEDGDQAFLFDGTNHIEVEQPFLTGGQYRVELMIRPDEVQSTSPSSYVITSLPIDNEHWQANYRMMFRPNNVLSAGAYFPEDGGWSWLIDHMDHTTSMDVGSWYQVVFEVDEVNAKLMIYDAEGELLVHSFAPNLEGEMPMEAMGRLMIGNARSDVSLNFVGAMDDIRVYYPSERRVAVEAGETGVVLPPTGVGAYVNITGSSITADTLVARHVSTTPSSTGFDGTARAAGGATIEPSTLHAPFWQIEAPNMQAAQAQVCVNAGVVDAQDEVDRLLLVKRSSDMEAWTPLNTSLQDSTDSAYLCADGQTSFGEYAVASGYSYVPQDRVFYLDFEGGDGVPADQSGFGSPVSVGGTDGGTIAYSDDAAAGDYSFDFDGSTYLEVPHSDTLTSEGLTVDLWFKVHEFSSGQTRLVSKVGGSTGPWWQANYQVTLFGDGGIRAGSYVPDRQGDKYLSNTLHIDDAIQDSTWYHLTYVIASDVAAIRVSDADGNLVGTKSIRVDNPPVRADGPLRIGQSTGGQNIFNGLVDEVQVYNYASDVMPPSILAVATEEAEYGPDAEQFTVNAQLRAFGSGMPNVSLHYDLGNGWQQTPMSGAGAGLYTGTITESPENGTVRYYVRAETPDGSSYSLAPATGSDVPYFIEVWKPSGRTLSLTFEEGEGTPADQSPYAAMQDVTVHGNAAYEEVDGDQVFVFDGQTYLEVQSPLLKGDQFRVEMRFQPDEVQGGDTHLITNRSSREWYRNNFRIIFRNDNVLSAGGYYPGLGWTVDRLNLTTPVESGQWYRAIYEVRGGVAQFEIRDAEGNLVDRSFTTLQGTTPIAASDRLLIGNSEDGESKYFVGKIDDVQVYYPAERTMAIEAGEEGMVFPPSGVGAYVNLTGSSASAGTLSGARHDEDPGSFGFIGSAVGPDGVPIQPTDVSSDRYWTFDDSDLAAYQADVCLDIDELPRVTAPGHLVVVQRDSEGDSWIPQTSMLQDSTGISYLCASGLTSFGEFGIASDEANPFGTVTIETARGFEEGTEVTLVGVLNTPDYGFNNGQFFVQDASGGINVFSPPVGGWGDGDSPFAPGDSVRIVGTVGSFNDQLQVSVADSADVEVLGESGVPGAVEIEPSAFTADSPLQGMRVMLQGLSLTEDSPWPTEPISSGSAMSVFFTNGTDTFEVRIDRGESFYDGTPRPEAVYDVAGTLSRFRDTPQLMLYFEGDLMNVTSGENGPALPKKFALHGNYPNPFNPSTTMRFDLPKAAQVTVDVFDVMGRRVHQVQLGQVPAGAGRELRFEAGNMASGMYFYRVTARAGDEEYSDTGRMVLLK